VRGVMRKWISVPADMYGTNVSRIGQRRGGE
jgi:hypothetical protein